MKRILFFIVFIPLTSLYAQKTTTVTGKVIESKTGNPIPFVNVVFQNTNIGITTDFDGNFYLKTTQPLPKDSLTASYTGYVKKTKKITIGTEQIIHFELSEEIIALKEIVFKAKENPAFKIIRNSIKNKEKHDKRNLSAYEYDSYTKVELDLNNISQSLGNTTIVNKIKKVLDSIQQMKDEKGSAILPVFFSETISKYHYKKNPLLQYEYILKNHASGPGVNEGSPINQMIGASFQDYNFYQNWVNIVNKEFVSPIADSWKFYYDYELSDTTAIVDNTSCYKIEYYPKRESDLAFRGTIWIDKHTFALKQIDANVDPSANINFIDKIKIQQELQPTTNDGAWLPSKTRVLVDMSEVSANTASMVGKFYVVSKNFVVNKPHPDNFYQRRVVQADTSHEDNKQYWEKSRYDTLTKEEKNVYKMVDTLVQIPIVRTYTEILRGLSTGYINIHKNFDIGPVSYTAAYNNIEGIRIGFGGRTSFNFSRKWEFSANIAYGFLDSEIKYRGQIRYIFNRNPWSEISFIHSKDIQHIWALRENIDFTDLFYTFSKSGTLVKPFYKESNQLTYLRFLGKGKQIKFDYTYEYLNPHSSNNFQYTKTIISDTNTTTTRYSQISISELNAQITFGLDDALISNGNRIRTNINSISTSPRAVITFAYSVGLKILGSTFNYHKFSFKLEKRQKMGVLGLSFFEVNATWIPNKLPYPLLKIQLGSPSPYLYFSYGNNLMSNFEFINDKYIALRWYHSFEGLFVNSIPLIKKTGIRLIFVTNIILGHIAPENFELTKVNKDISVNLKTFNIKPYIEIGYGVENIFKFFRIIALHRLTYINTEEYPNATIFAVKVGYRFTF
ncbi:MAG: DUF5686 family protein [Chitinophagaceae bacterium]|nr:DUF5686 family protein [Chitinophagaceae bacterium]